MHDEFPDWLLHSDYPPPEVREKLAAMLPTGPDAYYAIDNLCLIAHDFACTNIEQRRYRSVYNRQKRRAGSKNPHPGTQHAGEELKRIRGAAMELHDAIVSIRPHARRLLDKELTTTRIGREAILHQLHHLVDAIDGDIEEDRKGALALAGKGRKAEGIALLVDDIGRECRYALGRVPTQSELIGLIRAIFGDQFTRGENGVKNWCTAANAIPWDSEKEENR